MCYRYVVYFCVAFIFSCGMEPEFIPVKPEPDLHNDPAANFAQFGDVMREAREFEIYNGELLTVTKDFGPTIIRETNFPFQSELAVAKVKPWSSWWFPKKDKTLFSEEDSKNPSPLVKYDLVRQSRDSRLGSAAQFEQKNYFEGSLSWEGLCDAWALASILSPEPLRPVKLKVKSSWWSSSSVTLNIMDLKALILKSYEAIDETHLKIYGQKFTGNFDGWVFPDLLPEQFHRFLEVELFKEKKAFIMDHDPGIEVWNVPVYKANYVINAIPNSPNSVFVRTWIFSAEPVLSSEKDFVGTKEAIREYNYVLEGTRNEKGELVINSGYWTKGPTGIDSRKNHPDYVISVPQPQKIVRKSWNPEIEIPLIDEILSASY